MFLTENFLENDFLLFAKKKDGSINGMTCGWITEGRLFNEHVIMVFVRRNRYTFEFIDEADEFLIATIEDKSILEYFGSVSGRDEDKIKKAGLSFSEDNGMLKLDQASHNINLRKIQALDFKGCHYLDDDINEEYDENNRGHIAFVGVVEE